MKNNEYPEYADSAVLGNKGRRIVENIIHDSLGWLFREITRDDLGIDGIVEVIGEDRKSRGRLFAVQIKCGKSYLEENIGDGYIYRGETKHLNYWTEFSLPVVLILCDPESSMCHWVQINPASIERLSIGWKVVVPYSQTLCLESKWLLEMVVRTPQPNDVIPLALYRLLIEKFPEIVIAQELETPHDFWGFEYLADFRNDILLVTYIYKPTENFVPADIDEIIRRRDICSKGCGWDHCDIEPKIFVFFVAHNNNLLELGQDVIHKIREFPEIEFFRAVCNFQYGVSLIELDERGQYIDLYERKYNGA